MDEAATFNKITHKHDFILDLDGKVSCGFCGISEEAYQLSIFENQIDFE